MKKSYPLIALFCLFGLFGLLSCNNDEKLQKKETVSQQSEKIGQEAVKMIKTPLDQARKAAEQENSHGQTVEKEVEKSSN